MNKLLLLFSFATACGAPLDEATMDEEAILGGRAEDAPGAVAIFYPQKSATPRAYCTAFLIEPKVAITNGRCGMATLEHPALKFSHGGEIAVDRVETDPDGRNYNVPSASYELPFGNVAILFLHSAPSGITPAQLDTSFPANGAKLRVFGYGRTSPDKPSDLERKSALVYANTKDASFDSVILRRGDGQPCLGDAGGPIFYEGTNRVVAVFSAFTVADGKDATKCDQLTPYGTALASATGFISCAKKFTIDKDIRTCMGR